MASAGPGPALLGQSRARGGMALARFGSRTSALPRPGAEGTWLGERRFNHRVYASNSFGGCHERSRYRSHLPRLVSMSAAWELRSLIQKLFPGVHF